MQGFAKEMEDFTAFNLSKKADHRTNLFIFNLNEFTTRI
jgi:hypothetical protein